LRPGRHVHARRGVGGAGASRDDRNARTAGQFAGGFGHHRGAGLVATGYGAHGGMAMHRIKGRNDALAGNRKDVSDTLGAEDFDQDFATSGHDAVRCSQ